MTTPCTQEGKISEMSTNITNIASGIDKLNQSVEKHFTKLYATLEGNGDKVGLKTQTALNKQSITRVWWLIGLGIPAGTGIIGGLIILLI